MDQEEFRSFPVRNSENADVDSHSASSHAQDRESIQKPLHISCHYCHHWHNAVERKISTDSKSHDSFHCDHCGLKLFGFGRQSTHTSLLSQETREIASSTTVVPGRNSISCTNRAAILSLNRFSWGARPMQIREDLEHEMKESLGTRENARQPSSAKSKDEHEPASIDHKWKRLVSLRHPAARWKLLDKDRDENSQTLGESRKRTKIAKSCIKRFGKMMGYEVELRPKNSQPSGKNSVVSPSRSTHKPRTPERGAPLQRHMQHQLAEYSSGDAPWSPIVPRDMSRNVFGNKSKISKNEVIRRIRQDLTRAALEQSCECDISCECYYLHKVSSSLDIHNQSRSNSLTVSVPSPKQRTSFSFSSTNGDSDGYGPGFHHRRPSHFLAQIGTGVHFFNRSESGDSAASMGSRRPPRLSIVTGTTSPPAPLEPIPGSALQGSSNDGASGLEVPGSEEAKDETSLEEQ